LEAVPVAVAKKDLEGLQNAARKALDQPNLPPEVQQPLRALLTEAEKVPPLQRLMQALESGEASVLGALPKEALPGDLRQIRETAATLDELASVGMALPESPVPQNGMEPVSRQGARRVPHDGPERGGLARDH
jgi:hypothetical protein